MLAYLFTDLEASTRMWEEHREHMGAALARHDDIIRAAVVAHGGTVVKTTGDGWMATFPVVVECIGACLDAQLDLARETWATPEPLRVRMGINVGDAEPREGDYYGPAVNRAARIMAAGHGGQILLSAVAAEIAAGSLAGGVELRDLGAHRLKDLKEPERLFQVVHADLPADFPPLATLEARPNNLPVQVSEFFGRETELAGVRSMLEAPDVRLVTLTGPGGTGKTRLALQVAAELVEAYRDGVFFVDLAAERVPDAAFEAILRDLELTSSKEGSPLQVLKAKLRERHMLLVLDNFEQVTDAGVGVAELLRHCPRLEVIVTSREALRVRGEHLFAVPALGLPDPTGALSAIAASEAAQLFVERAKAANPGFGLSEANASAIAEILVRLDGLPLALELAAARLQLFSPSDLRDRLRVRIDVLGKGARDLPDRQRTLHSTIAWSYELLDPDECRLFELLAVFSTASLAAVEAVATEAYGDLDVIDLLASLVAKSLVRAVESAGTRRFTMLQTIREYAEERLATEPEQEGAVRLAHARYISGYASGLRGTLDGPEREAALADLSMEIGNLRTAWRYWVEAGDLEQLYVLLDGLWALNESRGWYHAAVELTTDLLSVLAATPASPDRDVEEMTLRTSLARALMAVRGFGPEVEQEFQRALALSSPTDAAARRVPVLRALASYYMNIAELAKSAALGREILDLARQEHDTGSMVEGHVVIGSTVSFIGSLPEGLDHLERAIELFDPATHGSGRFRLGPNAGVVARMASGLLLRPGGWPERAAGRVDEALELARGLDHPYSLAYALYHHGYFDAVSGRFESATACAAELERVAVRNDYPVWKALAPVVGGVASCGLGRAEEGLASVEAGLGFYRNLTTPPVFWPLLLALCGLAYLMGGRPERAVALLADATRHAGPDEGAYPEFRVLHGDAIAALAPADPAAAEVSYRAARRGAHKTGFRLTELAATTRLVELLQSSGGGRAEREDLSTLYGTFTEGLDEPELADALRVLGVA